MKNPSIVFARAYYFNWAGTSEEFKEFAGRMGSKNEGKEGVELVGIFAPLSKWHYVMVTKATSYEKALQAFKKYLRYGRPKASLGKNELFRTFEELGYSG